MSITFALLMALSAIAGETELEARARLAGEYDAEVGVVLEDGTECDLVSDRYALDVAMAADWRAAVGQSLLCASWANRAPGVILLRRRPDDETAVWRCGLACQRAGIHLFLEDEMSATVVGRKVFYAGSSFGENTPTSKTPLLPGGTATFANYISFAAGMKGIIVDIADLAAPGSITASDFAFKCGNDNEPACWPVGAAPDSVVVSEGGGGAGADRITLTWNDSVCQNSEWVQVTVLANANTGLPADDVHYWGWALGEVGDSEENATVTAADCDAIEDCIPSVESIEGVHDIDKNGMVATIDWMLACTNVTTEETDLNLISVPKAAVPGPYGVEAGELFHTGGTAGRSVVAGKRAGEVFHAGAAAGQIER